MKTVTFYHSVICPRCQLVNHSLKQLLPEFPSVLVDKIELLTNRARSRQEGVTGVPTLVAGDRRLSGFYLTKEQLRQFLKSLVDTTEVETPTQR